MFRLIQFILQFLSAKNEGTKEIEPHTIPASQAKQLWNKKGVLMKTSQAGLDLIKQFEGLKLSPYLDGVGIPTIGIGSTRYNDGTKVTMGDTPITEQAAYDLLSFHLQGVEACINSVVSIPLNQNQFDALACFTYNVGQGAFSSSTLLKKVNASDFDGASEEFERWDKAGGVVEAGLLRRRLAEKALFLA